MSKLKGKNRWCAVLLIFAALIWMLAGCSGSAAPTDGTESAYESSSEPGSEGEIDFTKEANISIASGTSGGNFYMVGTALAKIIQKYDPALICSSETTGGTGENIALVASESSTLGMGMADDVISAYEGERDYEGNAATNLRGICTGSYNTFHIIVMADSDIYSLEDLKGKQVSLGPAGAPYFGPDLLYNVCGYENGVDYQGQYLAHDQACDALSDGDIDAVIACLSFPASAYSNLAFTKDVRFISLTEEEMEKALGTKPAWETNTIPAGTYNGQDEDIIVPAVPIWFFTYEDMEEDIIYRVCKQIFENVEELSTIAVDAGYFDSETMIDNITIPVHPGAQRYYDEVNGNG